MSRCGDRAKGIVRDKPRGNTSSNVTQQHHAETFGVWLRSRLKVLWAGNRVASNRELEERSWRFESRCNGLVRARHLLRGGWSLTRGVRSATWSIRGGFECGRRSSSSQGAEGQTRLTRGLETLAVTRQRRVEPESRTASQSTEANGGNTAITHRDRRREPRGLEQAPQLTIVVHERASREKRAVRSPFRRESDTPARIR